MSQRAVGFLLGGAAFTDQYTFQLVGLGSQFITIASSQDPVVKEYTISDDDLRGPFAKKIPAKMETMKELPALAYTGVREKLAEKFHMRRRCSPRSIRGASLRPARPRGKADTGIDAARDLKAALGQSAAEVG